MMAYRKKSKKFKMDLTFYSLHAKKVYYSNKMMMILMTILMMIQYNTRI